VWRDPSTVMHCRKGREVNTIELLQSRCSGNGRVEGRGAGRSSRVRSAFTNLAKGMEGLFKGLSSRCVAFTTIWRDRLAIFEIGGRRLLEGCDCGPGLSRTKIILNGCSFNSYFML